MLALLNGPKPLVVPECYSALTARLVERAGFEAVYCGSNATSAMHYGIPDYGLVTTTELVENAARIASCVDIPLICDADQGGEQPINVARTVRGFERVGVAGIHIDDSRSLRGGATGSDALQCVSEMCTRIGAAVESRSSEDFALIARADGLQYGMEAEEVIERAVAYADAGADIIWCLGMPSGQIRRFAEAIPAPLMDVDHPVATAREGGLAIALFAGHAVSAAASLHAKTLSELRTSGSAGSAVELSKSDYLGLADWDGYTELAGGSTIGRA